MKIITKQESVTKVIVIEENLDKTAVVQLPIDMEAVLDLLNKFVVPTAITVPEKMRMRVIQGQDEYVFILKGESYKKVAISEICCLEADRSYCQIHLADSKPLTVTVPLNEVAEQLSLRQFVRIHRSFVVNLEYLDSYMGNFVVLKNGKELPIGREYKNVLKKYFVFIGSRKRVLEKKNVQ